MPKTDSDSRTKPQHHVFGTPLGEKDFTMLERSGISRQRAEQLPWRRVDHFTAAEMLSQGNSTGDFAGILIPYVWPGKDAPREYRLRRDHPDHEMKSDGTVKEKTKYIGAPGVRPMLYFAHGTQPGWLEDATLKIVLTEGEKKAESIWQLAWHEVGDAAERPSFLPIAIAGVWSWKGTKGKQDGPDGHIQIIKGPIPDLDGMVWQGREVVILFDSNVHSNDDVRIARFSLAKELRSRGASVRFADIPREFGLNGIDDVAGERGPEAALDILNHAYDPKAKQQPKTAGQPSRVLIDELPDVREIAAQKTEWLAPGLLAKGNITLITGPAGVGKTTLALWMANEIAQGGEILGGTCEKHPVLYITPEMPLGFAADIARRFGIDNGPGTNFLMWGPWNEHAPPEPAASRILQWVGQSEVSPLLVVDPLVAFLPHGTSENDSVDNRAFFEQGRTLLRNGAAGLVILHHTGKSETAQNYRGSSDIEASVDAAYKVTNSGDCVLDRLLLKLFKGRFLEQRKELVLIYSEDDDSMGSFRSDERPAAAVISTRQQLTNLFAEIQGCTTTEFIRAAKARKLTEHAARNYLKDGVATGIIEVETGPRNAQYHKFADGTLFPSGSGKVQ